MYEYTSLNKNFKTSESLFVFEIHKFVLLIQKYFTRQKYLIFLFINPLKANVNLVICQWFGSKESCQWFGDITTNKILNVISIFL